MTRLPVAALTATLCLSLSATLPDNAQAQTAQDSPIERYIELGLRANPALQYARQNAAVAHAEHREAKRGYLPTVDIQARYTRSGGGRTIEFPVGDLLNPAYTALNQLTGSSVFPQIENESIRFLREKEQESKVQLRQPVFQPQILPASRARSALARAADAGAAQVEADVVARVASEYSRYLQARESVEIYRATVQSLDEAVRVSRSLVASGLATNDAVFRIEADRAEIEQNLAEAEVIEQLAAAALNATLSREPDATIEPMDIDALRGAIAAPEPMPVADLTQQALAMRPAIRQLDASLDAYAAFVTLERGSYLPSVAIAADYGIQGSGYSFDDEARFRTASLVLQWTLFDGFRRKERVQQAQLRRDALTAQRESARDMIALEVRQAALQAQLADRNISVATRRVESAASAFRLTERRFGEGLATQLDLLDARAALTAAQVSLSINRFEALQRWVEVTRVAALRNS